MPWACGERGHFMRRKTNRSFASAIESLEHRSLLSVVPIHAASEWNQQVALVGNEIYFVGFDSVHGSELWKSDGTTLGTQLVRDITPGTEDTSISQFTVVGSKIYFVVDESALW